MKYMVHASNTMWRVKNQPSNSTSCSDNTLHLLNTVVGKFYWVWGCLLKGCLREVYFEMQNPLEGHSLKTSILNNWLYSSCLEKSFFVCPVLSSNTLANDKKSANSIEQAGHSPALIQNWNINKLINQELEIWMNLFLLLLLKKIVRIIQCVCWAM